MNIILQTAETLRKEKQNSLLIEKQYTDELEKLPKGTLETKKQYHQEYFYYTYYDRNAHKKISKFLGKDKSVISELQEQIDRKKYLKKELKKLSKYIKAISDMLKVSDKYTQQRGVREYLKEICENKDFATANQSEIIKK